MSSVNRRLLLLLLVLLVLHKILTAFARGGQDGSHHQADQQQQIQDPCLAHDNAATAFDLMLLLCSHCGNATQEGASFPAS